jgi:hypothetical protein
MTSQSDSIVSLLSKLARDFVTLGKQEAQLAGIEVKKKLIGLAIGVVALIIIALIGVAILATLTATLILAFTLIVPPWLAALIVTGIYLLLAIILAIVAKINISRAIPPVPQQTLTTIKENVAWAKRLLK